MTTGSGSVLLGLLRLPEFRRVWLAGMLTGIARWLEMLALGIYAFETTRSPFLVALLVIARMLPLALFGPFVGALADRMDPRRLLVGSMGLILLVAVTMFVLFLTEVAGYWHVAAAAFLAGSLWTTDMPLRRRILGDVAGADRLGPAMALDSATNNGTRMIGPLFGGLLFQMLGATGVYAVSAGLACLSLLLVLALLRDGGAAQARSRPVTSALTDLVAAVRFALATDDVRRILLVTVVFNVWGFPFTSMIPVIGRDDLGLASGWVGVLSALEGLGAFTGALLIAGFARPERFLQLYYFGTMAFLVLVFGVGVAPGVFMVGAMLACAGLGAAAFSTMQSTLTYLTAPPAMRGRMFGLLVLCIGSGLLGFSNVGLMAEWFGAAVAIRIIAVEGLIALLVVGLGWGSLRRPFAAPGAVP
ncbi:MAG: MFS transporter [Roseitalea porphyridii]